MVPDTETARAIIWVLLCALSFAWGYVLGRTQRGDDKQ